MLHIELAPEILLLNRAPDLKSDIWALGATILEILLEKVCFAMYSVMRNFYIIFYIILLLYILIYVENKYNFLQLVLFLKKKLGLL